ncbi:uncharacterized protein LOC132036768 isoform X1 [Lycium ferocissimum]|uniref:uncharacterized protein LOC132036768 isoform X1 n=1 Tax=Lycium ferocissimum TaxID=112874 RepID=UPI0028152FA3|nr:uncharacterized protein LOC132036768 isoform X1 [Lycium ferocissimum]
MFSISLSLHSLLPPPCHSFWFSSFLSSKSSQDPLAQRRNWQSRGKKKDEQFDIISEARLTVHISRQTFYLTTITSISVTVGYLNTTWYKGAVNGNGRSNLAHGSYNMMFK